MSSASIVNSLALYAADGSCFYAMVHILSVPSIIVNIS